MTTEPASTGRRRALLVATGHYEDQRLLQLRSPVGDAAALARVLADDAIGGFDTELVENAATPLVGQKLEAFFDDARLVDLLLLYITGHGILSPVGELYFATSNTRFDLLRSSAISSAFLTQLMDHTRSRKVVVLLDTCHSGAFTKGLRSKAVAESQAAARLSGAGRVVLTASTALEYAFEEEAVTDLAGSEQRSVFTSAIIEGLGTGDADRDQDGRITIDELYDYVYDRVRRATPFQTPSLASNVRGTIVIARNPRVSGSAPQPGREPVLEPREPPRGPIPEPTELPHEPILEPTPEASEDARYEAEPIATGDYWTVADELGYADYADAIAAFIQHPDTRPPLTIGIKAPWGAGKTSLMRMVQDALDPVQRGSSGGGDRAAIRLTEESRSILAVRDRRPTHRADDTLEPVTVGTVLRRLRDDTSTVDRPVRADPQTAAELRGVGERDWRPTVWFNPWMYESGEQIWAGLAHEFISQITHRMSRTEREHFWLALNLARVDEQAVRRRIHRILFARLLPITILAVTLCILAIVILALNAAFGLASAVQTAVGGLFSAGAGATILAGVVGTLRFRGETASATLERLVSEPDYAKTIGGQLKWDDIVAEPRYDQRLGFLYLVHTDTRRVLDLVATPERPLVVFVDDLDRCSPTTVSQVIEAINLFLAGEFPNCIFVIAMEPEVVAAHIEVAHRPLVDMLAARGTEDRAGTLGWRLLEKIVQLPLSLPKPPRQRVGSFLGAVMAPPTAQRPVGPEQIDGEGSASGRNREDKHHRARQSEDGNTQLAATPDHSHVATRHGEASRTRLEHDSPEVLAIVAAFAGQLDGTPREVKRFVNVFRFYAFVQQKRATSGAVDAVPLIHIAKLAMIAVRWPHLRSMLGAPVPVAEQESVLEAMEGALRQIDSAADEDETRAALDKRLADAGIRPTIRDTLAGREDLCAFLAGPPRLESTVASLL